MFPSVITTAQRFVAWCKGFPFLSALKPPRRTTVPVTDQDIATTEIKRVLAPHQIDSTAPLLNLGDVVSAGKFFGVRLAEVSLMRRVNRHGGSLLVRTDRGIARLYIPQQTDHPVTLMFANGETPITVDHTASTLTPGKEVAVRFESGTARIRLEEIVAIEAVDAYPVQAVTHLRNVLVSQVRSDILQEYRAQRRAGFLVRHPDYQSSARYDAVAIGAAGIFDRFPDMAALQTMLGASPPYDISFSIRDEGGEVERYRFVVDGYAPGSVTFYAYRILRQVDGRWYDIRALDSGVSSKTLPIQLMAGMIQADSQVGVVTDSNGIIFPIPGTGTVHGNVEVRALGELRKAIVSLRQSERFDPQALLGDGSMMEVQVHHCGSTDDAGGGSETARYLVRKSLDGVWKLARHGYPHVDLPVGISFVIGESVPQIEGMLPGKVTRVAVVSPYPLETSYVAEFCAEGSLAGTHVHCLGFEGAPPIPLGDYMSHLAGKPNASRGVLYSQSRELRA